MAVIKRNQYGAIAVNKGVLSKIIIGQLLEMSDVVIPCNKKGKPIKEKPTPFIDPDYYDSVEVYEKKHVIRVKVYIITRFGSSISDIAEELFNRIETALAEIEIEKPGRITINIKGIMATQLMKRDIEVIRRND